MMITLKDLVPIRSIPKRAIEEARLQYGLGTRVLLDVRITGTNGAKQIHFGISSHLWDEFQVMRFPMCTWIDFGHLQFDTAAITEDTANEISLCYLQGLPDGWDEERYLTFRRAPIMHADRLLADICTTNENRKPATLNGDFNEFMKIGEAIVGYSEIHRRFPLIRPGIQEMDTMRRDRAFEASPAMMRLFDIFQPIDRGPLRRSTQSTASGMHVVFGDLTHERAMRPSSHQKMIYAKIVRNFYREQVSTGLTPETARDELAAIGLTL